MAQAAFEDVVAELAKYFSVSKSLGGNVATQADHIQKAVNLSKEFIGKALGMKKPGESDLMAMLGPISQEMSKVGEIKDKGRGDKNFNNLNAAAEGVQALGWLAVEPKPGPFIKETTGSAQFWTNKILKEFKGNNEDQVAWATSLVAFLQALEKYVMQYHTTGVAWNSGGAAKAAAPASAPAAGGGSSSIQTEFEELIASHLNPFVELSQKIGGPVASQVALLKQATQLELEVVIKAAGSKEKPKPEEFMEKWLKPISTLMTQIAEFPAKNRGHANFDHLSSVGEGAQILGWVAVEPTPAPFAKEVIPSAQFWTNKILKNFKGKDETQVAWANGLVAFLQAFPPYIASHHTTGLKFNATIANKAAPVQTATATGGASLTDFDNLVSEHVQPYLQLSAKIGDVVNQQAQLVDQAVKQLRQLIEHAGKTKPKPSPDAFQKLLTPIVEPMTKVTELKDKNRSSKYFDHLNATAEAISTIGWVTVEPAPAPFAKETAGGAVFYTNKILKLYKGKEEDHVEWVKHLNGFFQGLEGYIKQHHMTGLSWGTAANKPAAVQAAPAGGGGCVDDFQAIIDEFITPYVTISKELGGVVAQQAELVLTAVKHEKELIGKAKTMKKPSEDALMQMIKPIGDTMAKVSELKEKNRKDPLWNHLSTVAEGISILGWVTVEPTPGPFAKEAIGSSEFWSNKILKDVRGKDEKQENWVKAFNGFLKAIPGYIQQHHTTGLSWSK